MKKALKEAWLQALRSGRRKQGKGFLHAGDEYCCLGVLAEIAGAKWEPQGAKFNDASVFRCQYGQEYFNDGEQEGDLDVLALLGLPEELHKLAYLMNDGIFEEKQLRKYEWLEERRYSFEEIADKMEELL